MPQRIIVEPDGDLAGADQGGGEGETYRLVEGPRLQQRSEKRQPMMPARRKMPEVTRNPIAGLLAGRVAGCSPREVGLRRIAGRVAGSGWRQGKTDGNGRRRRVM
jgi:hypothetical protein